MKIGILGSGSMATALGHLWSARGHQVMLSFSRDPAKLQRSAQAIGGTAGSAADAAAFGDVIVLATGWSGVGPALTAAGPMVGKVLWTLVTPLKPDLSGLDLETAVSGTEHIAARAPGVRFVACWPPFAQALASETARFDGLRQTVFMCGDEPEAKRAIQPLLEPLDVDVADAGPLRAARFIEPTMMLLVHLAYAQGLGPVALRLLRQRGTDI